jgi:uncharacterized protein (DUF2126 family)
VLPLKAVARAKAANQTRWQSSPWPLRREKIFLIEGDSPSAIACRWRRSRSAARGRGAAHPRDPFDAATRSGNASPRAPRRPPSAALRRSCRRRIARGREDGAHGAAAQGTSLRLPAAAPAARDFLSLSDAIESTAQALGLRVRLEGYPPPMIRASVASR